MASISTSGVDRKKGGELTPELRAAIVANYQAGDTSQAQIATQFGVYRNTVIRTIQGWRQQNTNISRPRSGRPLKYDGRSRRLMTRNKRRDRLSSNQQKKGEKKKKIKSDSGSLPQEAVVATKGKDSGAVQLKKKKHM